MRWWREGSPGNCRQSRPRCPQTPASGLVGVPTSAPAFGVRTEAGAWPSAWASGAIGLLTTGSFGLQSPRGTWQTESNSQAQRWFGRTTKDTGMFRAWVHVQPQARRRGVSSPNLPSVFCLESTDPSNSCWADALRSAAPRACRRPLPAHGSLHR